MRTIRAAGAFATAVVLVLVLGLAAVPPAAAHDQSCRTLHEAVFMDEPEQVLQLIKRGIDVNCLDELRHTPIITATTGASLESFRVLIRHGAKINVKDEWGQSLIRRIQEGIAKYSMQGGGPYRRIYQRMAEMVEQSESRN